jgi:DNA polymerase V
MFALIDCDNFYATCEAVFNPKLMGLPLVILSNNDGCIIARSKEAKQMGIQMGEPAFHYRNWIDAGKLHTLSSNFPLYADMSHRVVQTLMSFDLPFEIYSIDEAFLSLEDIPLSKIYPLVFKIRQTILRWTGIKVSIGVGKTKTLAKAATRKAKKGKGIYLILNNRTRILHLQSLDVKDIWGIGSRLAKRLYRHQIYTAWDLVQTPSSLIQKLITVQGVRIMLELEGKEALSLDNRKDASKSILCSRTFNRSVSEKSLLEESLASFTSRAAEKLREQSLKTAAINVFIQTSKHKQDYYFHQSTVTMPIPTSYTPTLIRYAKKALHSVYIEDLPYKKLGVILVDLSPDQVTQKDLFSEEPAMQKQDNLMKVIDAINRRYDKEALFFLGKGDKKDYTEKREKISSSYTTRWDEIPTVK